MRAASNLKTAKLRNNKTTCLPFYGSLERLRLVVETKTLLQSCLQSHFLSQIDTVHFHRHLT